MTPDKSKVNLSSADVRITNQRGRGPDPFWPEIALNFPATPSEVYDWATCIFLASDLYSETNCVYEPYEPPEVDTSIVDDGLIAVVYASVD